ncbi:abortive infection family protein [Rhodothermus marinus]|uniref:abortive infection family protein n=1 Tax=Rhodothermus marinus TaxID=29549 RepID=UPI0006CF2B0A|nr:abortive infection family protein [Rhodothermus marinus]
MSGNRLDDIAPAFRAAVERWPDAPNLQQHYRDLARAWEGEGSSVIELIKSFLECVCWTVLNELDAPKPDSSTPTTSELLSCVLDALGLRNQRGVGPLGKVISGHNKLVEGLNELRNQDGSVAHGRDGFVDAIANRHMRYICSRPTRSLRSF